MEAVGNYVVYFRQNFRLTTVYVDMKKQKVSITCDGTPVSAIHLFKMTKRNYFRESDITLLKSNVIINDLIKK